MKRKLLLFISFFTSSLLLAQHSIKELNKIVTMDVIKLEGITYSGSHVLGIYSTRAEALSIAEDFQKEHRKENRLTYKTIKPVRIESSYGENAFAKFKELFPKGYILLSVEDYNTLQILKNDNREAALWYYMKTKRAPKEKAVEKLDELAINYTKYL